MIFLHSDQNKGAVMTRWAVLAGRLLRRQAFTVIGNIFGSLGVIFVPGIRREIGLKKRPKFLGGKSANELIHQSCKSFKVFK